MWKRSIEIIIAYDSAVTGQENYPDKNYVEIGGEQYASKADVEVKDLLITRGRSQPFKQTNREIIRIAENKIDFMYQAELGFLYDMLKIDVYNLDINTLNALLDTKKKTIIMSIGYEDQEMSVLLDGYIANVAGRKAMPNHITSIWAVPKYSYMLSKKSTINTVYVKSDSLRNVINELVITIGFSAYPKFYGIDDDVLDQTIKGYVFDGSPKQALFDLGKQYGFFVKPTNSTVNIVSRLLGARTIDKIAQGRALMHQIKTNKVKGVPEAAVGSMNLTYNLDAGISCGDVMDMSLIIDAGRNAQAPSQSIISVNNAGSKLYRTDTMWKSIIMEKYLIRSIVHTGSNFANTWDTRITGAYWIDGTAANKPGNGDPSMENIGTDEDTREVDRLVNGVYRVPDQTHSFTFGGDSATGYQEQDQPVPYKPGESTLPLTPTEGAKSYPAYKSEPLDTSEDAKTTTSTSVKPTHTPIHTPSAPHAAGNLGVKKSNGKEPPKISDRLSPAEKKMANVIKQAESGNDYSAVAQQKGNPYGNLQEKSFGEIKKLQQQEKGAGRSGAMGAYQVVQDNMEERMKSLGLSDTDKFTAENQDLMFKDTLDNKRLQESKMDRPISKQVEAMGQEYAAAEAYPNKGYYDDGVNNATIPYETMENLIQDLNEEREGG